MGQKLDKAKKITDKGLYYTSFVLLSPLIILVDTAIRFALKEVPNSYKQDRKVNLALHTSLKLVSYTYFALCSMGLIKLAQI